MQVGELLDKLAQRTRDPDARVVPLGAGLLLLQAATRAINSRRAAITAEINYTWAERRLVYALKEINETDIDKPVIELPLRVEFAGMEINGPVSWKSIFDSNRYAFRRFDEQPFVWGPVGRKQLIVYPGPKADVAGRLVYVAQAPDLTAPEQDWPLPDELASETLELAEALYLLRARLLGQSAAAMMASKSSLGATA